MTEMSIRDISLNVKVIGKGYPLVLMHGGPGFDLYTMMAFRPLADRFTLVLYDQRCNGRSGGEVSSMTWENLTADADALRLALGFDRWAVLGHSFGGMVAMEYALRYPESISHLLLVDTGGEARWVQEKAPEILEERGCSPDVVSLTSRLFNGQIAPDEFSTVIRKLGPAMFYHLSPWLWVQLLVSGLRMKTRPEAAIFWFGQYLRGWTVMDRLGEIQVPTLVLAGRDDFQFPPEHQMALAAGIPGARLVIIERAGHNSPEERPAEVLQAVRDFLKEGK